MNMYDPPIAAAPIHPCQRRPYQPSDGRCITKNCNGATRASDDAERSNILFSQRILNPAHHCANAADNEGPLGPLPDGIASFERHTSGHCCVRSAEAMEYGLATRSRWKSFTEIPVAECSDGDGDGGGGGNVERGTCVCVAGIVGFDGQDERRLPLQPCKNT